MPPGRESEYDSRDVRVRWFGASVVDRGYDGKRCLVEVAKRRRRKRRAKRVEDRDNVDGLLREDAAKRW